MFFSLWHTGNKKTRPRNAGSIEKKQTVFPDSDIVHPSLCLYCRGCVCTTLFNTMSSHRNKDFSRPHRARLGSRRHLCYIFLHISKIYYRSFRGSGGVRNVTGRVGSRRFQISRFGSGRVKRFSNLSGRVGSGQEVFENYGSGRVGWSQKVFKSHESDRVGK